jgi:golgi SNAP receptor complex member 2
MLQELIAEDRRRIHELEQQLLDIEKGTSSVQISDVYIGLGEMADRLEDLNTMAGKEPKGRRDDMRRRIMHLQHSHVHVRTNLENLVRRQRSKECDFNRMQLFGESGGEKDYSGVDLEMAEGASLSSSSHMVNSYIDLGRDTLVELAGQKDRLKSVHRKVYDILNYLGLSGVIMRNVESRDQMDKYIVYAGMLLVTSLLLGLWWFLG